MSNYRQQLLSEGLRGEMGTPTQKGDALSKYQLGADNYAQTAKELGTGLRDAAITNPIKDWGDMKQAVSDRDPLEAALIGAGYIPEIGGTLKKMGKALKNDMFIPADTHEAIMAAEDMFRSGKSPDEIWKEHGLVQFDPEDGWKREIPDEDSAFIGRLGLLGKHDTTVGDSLMHKELYNAEPYLKDMPLQTERTLLGSNYGGFSSRDRAIEIGAPNNEKARDIGLHEIQHAIQNEYGWARGADPNMEFSELMHNLSRGKNEAPEMIQKYDDVVGSIKNWDTLPGEARMDAMSPHFGGEAYARYLRSGGEAEARLVQLRKNMPPELLRATTPKLEDVLRPTDFKLFSDETADYIKNGGSTAPIFRRDR